MAALHSGQHGFTFFEALIVLVILGIALAMGVPTLQDSILRSRVVNDTGSLLTTLIYARNQAITGGNNVVVCASSDKTTCTGSWDQGWIVFRDDNADGALQPASETILRKHGGLDKVTVTPSTTATTNTKVGFTSRGYTTANAGYKFKFCGPGTNGTWHGREIDLLNTGRAVRVPTSTTVSCP